MLAALSILCAASLAGCSDGALSEQEAATLIFRELARSERDLCTRPHTQQVSAWARRHANNGAPYVFGNMTEYFRSGALHLGDEHGLNVQFEHFDGGMIYGRGSAITCDGSDCAQHISGVNIVLRSSSLELCLDYLAGPQNITVERIDVRDDRHARAYFSMQGEYTSLFAYYEEQATGPNAICLPGECIHFRDEMVIAPCVGPNGNAAFTRPVARARMNQVTALGRRLWSMDIRGEQCFADFRRTEGVWSLRDTYTAYFALP